jgi:hypothetical protein
MIANVRKVRKGKRKHVQDFYTWIKMLTPTKIEEKYKMTWKDVEKGEKGRNNSSLNAESVARSSEKIEHKIKESRQKD